ncbi:MAG TPA: SMP-30/gluconolactonase/LRE family protein [Streptosporangiaceae bacterium]|nr:SMP-30/gluconolactonase/LRE family protein [Streptosporangiaceae bacterium]
MTPGAKAWSAIPGLLSEGPRWHEERQELLWVDILGRQMHRGTLNADDAMERVETISVDRHIGAVAPATGGGYVLAAGPGFLFVDDAGSVRELAQPAVGRTGVRMNDGACDQQGRFWAGTMAYDESPGAGALYRLELDGNCTTVLTGLTISNGIGWSPDVSTMYLNDSGTGCVDTFAFDGPSGALRGRPHAHSAGLTGTRCSLPARGTTSTTRRWPDSRTPDGFSRSADSVSAASPACPTAAGHRGYLGVRQLQTVRQSIRRIGLAVPADAHANGDRLTSLTPAAGTARLRRPPGAERGAPGRGMGINGSSPCGAQQSSPAASNHV